MLRQLCPYYKTEQVGLQTLGHRLRTSPHHTGDSLEGKGLHRRWDLVGLQTLGRRLQTFTTPSTVTMLPTSLVTLIVQNTVELE